MRAVLETSFWVAAHRADVAVNSLDLFEIIVPQAVEAEIRSVQAAAPAREYPYATLFRRLRAQMSDPPAQIPAPLPISGAGEAEAIVLAEHLGAALLINERRGTEYAIRRGMVATTVPDVIVMLRGLDIISDRAARTKLALIEPITAKALIAGALHALDTRERLP